MDEPAKSWKDRDLEKTEKLMESYKNEAADLKKQVAVLKGKRQGYSDLLTTTEKFIKLFEDEDVEYLADVISGNIEYVVEDRYSLSITKFEDGIFSWDNSYGDRRYEGLKMMSLYAVKGSSFARDRKYKTKLNAYPDGSGGWKDVKLIKNKAALEKHLVQLMESKYSEGKLGMNVIKELRKYIHVPEEYVEVAMKKKRDEYTESLESTIKNAKEIYDRNIKDLNCEGGK